MDPQVFRRRMTEILDRHDEAFAHLRTAHEHLTGTSPALVDIIARQDAALQASNAAIDAAIAANRAALALLREMDDAHG